MIKKIDLGMVNAFIIEEEGTILVDTGTKSSAKKLVHYLMKHQYLDKINLIILTHNHSDHIGGISKILEYKDIPVLMHRLDVDAMMGLIHDDVKPQVLLTKFIYLFKKDYTPIKVSPTQIMESTIDLSPYGVKGHILHTPGHTKGSISIVIGQEAIIGDQLMAFRKLPHKPIVAYDLNLTKKSMEQLLARDIEKFHLSHGHAYNRQEIQVALDQLK